ncbi:hypothetical protein M0802_013979 [Mischocyttarus mexicanus]|nr:hypothetical protein M0802_013979 [Mischocyttarus mexicanus]
MKQLGLRLMN